MARCARRVTLRADSREFQGVSFERLCHSTGAQHASYSKRSQDGSLRQESIIGDSQSLPQCAWRSADSSEKSMRALAAGVSSAYGHLLAGGLGQIMRRVSTKIRLE